jgi:hypothetical protein
MFLNNKKGKEILYEDLEMRDTLKEFEDAEEEAGGMFGSLGKLGGNFLKTGLGAISTFKKGLDNAMMKDDAKRKQEEMEKKEKKKEVQKKAI